MPRPLLRTLHLILIGVAAGIIAACAPIEAAPAETPIPLTTAPPMDVPLPATATPSPPSVATALPTLTATPTAQPISQPTLGYYNITPRADATLVTPFPTPVTPATLPDSVVNILLIGTDYRPYISKSYRTDTLIIVSINIDSGLVTMISIPRDLFVYVPTWGMTRINTAYDVGERIVYPGGGAALLEQTILYNLGVPIHHYALINFDGFRKIVDTLGGLEVAVNCRVTEYRLKSPELDERVKENYELYDQPIGVTKMDGDLALWYARARPVGGDYFRSYRQRQVLRAIYRAARTADLIPQIPSLYVGFKDVVTTDMGVWDVMQFAPLATRLEETQIRSLPIGPNQVTPWTTPNGDSVLLPNAGAVLALMTDAFQPPNANQLQRPGIVIEIVNASGQAGWEHLAAETLRNEGFAPVLSTETPPVQATTTLIDFTTSAKGSPLKTLLNILHIAEKHVQAQPDANSPIQFRVTLGEDYNSCPRLDWMAP